MDATVHIVSDVMTQGRVVGVVSEADLLPKEEFRDSDPRLRSTWGIPTTQPPRPVVDAVGLLEGVVSRADLLKVCLRADDEIAEEVRRGASPACSPRRTRASAWRCWTAWSSSSARSGTPRWCRWQHGWSGPSRASWTWTSASHATSSRPGRRTRPQVTPRAPVLHEPARSCGGCGTVRPAHGHNAAHGLRSRETDKGPVGEDRAHSAGNLPASTASLYRRRELPTWGTPATV
ncbi:hypothetical protein SALBM311S_10063 [Streptomyces alboniger]